VAVVGDTIDEGDETFFVDLSSPRGATIDDARGEATIMDNDTPPTVAAVSAVTVPEGNAGTNPFASVDVTLSQASGRDVSVAYATVDGTATTADNDYDAKSGTIDFAPGQTLQTILVQVVGDDAAELDETFDVQLSAPVHASLGERHNGRHDHQQRSVPPGLRDPERLGSIGSRGRVRDDHAAHLHGRAIGRDHDRGGRGLRDDERIGERSEGLPLHDRERRVRSERNEQDRRRDRHR